MPAEIDDELVQISFNQYFEVVKKECESMDEAAEVARKTILGRLAISVLHRNFNELMESASKDGNALNLVEKMNMAAFRILYEKKVMAVALNRPDQVHSVLTKLNSTDKNDLLIQPNMFMFTDIKNSNSTLFRVDALACRFDGMSHPAFEFCE